MHAQPEMQLGQAKLKLREQEILLKDDRERDKTAIEGNLREKEIEARYNVDIHDAQLRSAVAQDRALMDADLKAKAEEARAAQEAAQQQQAAQEAAQQQQMQQMQQQQQPPQPSEAPPQ